MRDDKVQGGSYIYDYCKTADKLSLRPRVNSTHGGSFYDETVFGKFENYLVNQELAAYDELI